MGNAKQKEKGIGLLLFFLCSFSFLFTTNFSQEKGIELVRKVQASSDASEENDDKELYERYKAYLKYEGYRKYKKYKEKYAFETKEERAEYKRKYDFYKSNKKKYAYYYEEYKRYKNYKNKYREYRKYSKYKKYYQKGWRYKKYGKTKYKNGYNRYKQVLANKASNIITSGNTGPEITVGILSYEKSYSEKHSFKIKANKNYNIKDKNGGIIAGVLSDTVAQVNYISSGKLRVFGTGFDSTVDGYIDFDAQDGDNSSMIFNVEPKQFDDYRGKIRVRYSQESKKVWVINTLPLEHYTWGMGEISGTGAMEYNKVMTVTYRTYGYWKIKYSTKYEEEGFKVDATAGNQVYYGYDWETSHSRIKTAAEATRGKIVKYGDRIAITPYSSSTDGRTRSWKERWGSSNYPWCQSVSDPYGKVTGAESIVGNHMVGLSATGALNLATDHNWDYDRILNYYYTGITITEVY